MASWIHALPDRDFPVEVFTTNYDLLMEQALERLRVPYFDGFVGSHRTFFDVSSMDEDRFPARWARVWKLHGSINWRQSKDDQVVTRGESFSPGEERRLIHPSHLKYEESRRMPYLAMIDRLRAFFRHSPVVLVTCGFSFSDQHLNEVIQQGLEGNATAICFALLHGKLEVYGEAIQLATVRPNLNLLASEAAIVGRRRGSWSASTDEAASNVEKTGAGAALLEGPPPPRFLLGDFARFGQFLTGEIVGPWQEEIPNDGS